MNLTIITQAISGSVLVQDHGRDREFKRTRRQISEGIKGASIGAALLGIAVLAYFLIQAGPVAYSVTLVLALVGLIKFFINLGTILDAKVGTKFVDPTLQPRASGGLTATTTANVTAGILNSVDHRKPVAPTARASQTGALQNDIPPGVKNSFDKPPVIPGRVNREHSMPLRKLEADDDLMAKLRN